MYLKTLTNRTTQENDTALMRLTYVVHLCTRNNSASYRHQLIGGTCLWEG